VRFRVVDLETTGLSPPAEVIELGRVDVYTDQGTWRIDSPLSKLYRPLKAIPPEAMAVHHITFDDFGPDTPIASDGQLTQDLLWGPHPDVLVAHNCDFERQFITDAVSGGAPWICTFKAALRIWPEAPQHSNQVLRYWRDLRLDRTLATPSHRAGPDAWVTAHLLTAMLSVCDPAQLVQWTAEPKLYPTISFGKHRGARWSEIPTDYLQWMIRQNEMDPDAIWCARQELDRRR
jgi:exodeoxyribonuclease X